jgi:hypothetical protein
MPLTRAVDTDFGGGGTPPPQEWFDNLVTLGYEGFITTSHTYWDGNPQPNPNANISLQRALNAGLWIGCYARPVHYWEDAINVLDPEIRSQLKFFTLDVEHEPSGTYPVLREYVTGVESYGVRPIIYSSSSLWSDVMGPDNEDFADVPLHDFAGDIDGWPTVIYEEPIETYGGWNTPQTMRVGWQIRMIDPPSIDGIPVDDNVFTREFIFGEEPDQIEEGHVGTYTDHGWTDSLTVYPVAASIPNDTYLLHVTSNASPEITGGLDQWTLMTKLKIGSGTTVGLYTYTGQDVPGETTIQFEGEHWHTAALSVWRGYGVTDFGTNGSSGSSVDIPFTEIDEDHEGLVVHFGFHWDGEVVSFDSDEVSAVAEILGGSSVLVSYETLPEVEADGTPVPLRTLIADTEGRMAVSSVVLSRQTEDDVELPAKITVKLFPGVSVIGDMTRGDSGDIVVQNLSLSFEE